MRWWLLAGVLWACSNDLPGPESTLPGPVVGTLAEAELQGAKPAAALADPTDVVMGLVDAPGRDTVLANCVACHSTALITQNHMSRERWDATLTWMQKTQGLWEIPTSDRASILDYLAVTQGVRGGARGDFDSPWAAPLYRPNPLW